eukprot:351827_1
MLVFPRRKLFGFLYTFAFLIVLTAAPEIPLSQTNSPTDSDEFEVIVADPVHIQNPAPGKDSESEKEPISESISSDVYAVKEEITTTSNSLGSLNPKRASDSDSTDEPPPFIEDPLTETKELDNDGSKSTTDSGKNEKQTGGTVFDPESSEKSEVDLVIIGENSNKKGSESLEHIESDGHVAEQEHVGIDAFRNKLLGDESDDQKPKVGEPAVDEEKSADFSSRFNFASQDAGAVVLETGPETKGAPTILTGNDDRYMIISCNEDRKWFVIQLSEEIKVDTIVLSNLEHYSSNFRKFQLLGSTKYPTEHWTLLGTFDAKDDRERQAFRLKKPTFSRFLRINLLTHYGTEFYCTLTHFQAHGLTLMETLRSDLEISEKEVKQALDKADDVPSDSGETPAVEDVPTSLNATDADSHPVIRVEADGTPRNRSDASRDTSPAVPDTSAGSDEPASAAETLHYSRNNGTNDFIITSMFFDMDRDTVSMPSDHDAGETGLPVLDNEGNEQQDVTSNAPIFQNIFKTLTNRVKHLEINQSVSNRYMEKGSRDFVAFSNNVTAQLRDISASMKNLRKSFEKMVADELEKLFNENRHQVSVDPDKTNVFDLNSEVDRLKRSYLDVREQVQFLQFLIVLICFLLALSVIVNLGVPSMISVVFQYIFCPWPRRSRRRVRPQRNSVPESDRNRQSPATVPVAAPAPPRAPPAAAVGSRRRSFSADMVFPYSSEYRAHRKPIPPEPLSFGGEEKSSQNEASTNTSTTHTSLWQQLPSDVVPSVRPSDVHTDRPSDRSISEKFPTGGNSPTSVPSRSVECQTDMIRLEESKRNWNTSGSADGIISAQTISQAVQTHSPPDISPVRQPPTKSPKSISQSSGLPGPRRRHRKHRSRKSKQNAAGTFPPRQYSLPVGVLRPPDRIDTVTPRIPINHVENKPSKLASTPNRPRMQKQRSLSSVPSEALGGNLYQVLSSNFPKTGLSTAAKSQPHTSKKI